MTVESDVSLLETIGAIIGVILFVIFWLNRKEKKNEKSTRNK